MTLVLSLIALVVLFGLAWFVEKAFDNALFKAWDAAISAFESRRR